MKYKLKMDHNKKGASLWLSWVLLFMFMIMLSATSYKFILPYVQDTTDNMKQDVFNTEECRQVSLGIESACYDASSPEYLNITINNNNYILVEDIRIQLFNESMKPITTLEINSKISTGRTKKYSINTTVDYPIGFMKITPVVYKEGKTIVCANKDVSTKNIVEC